MRLRTTLRLLCGTLALSCFAGGGYTWAAAEEALPKGGVNILVAGLDSRAGLNGWQRAQYNVGGVACGCTDTLMVVHLSADGKRASVVSLPRDSYVKFAPHVDAWSGSKPVTHYGKINAARQHGGRQTAIRTVEQATGLDIHHYLETDIRGFIRTVDRLNGTKVCTKFPLHDANAGLNMSTGTHYIKGKQAIRFVRARHIEGIGDIGRVRRQQGFMANLTGHKIESGALTNKPRFAKILSLMLKDVHKDTGTTFAELAQLGWQMRHLKMENVEFATVPVSSIGYNAPGWGSSVKWSDERAARLFGALRADKPMKNSDVRRPGSFADNFGKTIAGSKLMCR
ncbi:LCP family protein [Streptomyces sp. NPDC051940]|uniref:LCP family protein n=1 Tax=Streptomyces sp. NPDC051940 TaxID=3155675 RepID=UPI00344834A6